MINELAQQPLPTAPRDSLLRPSSLKCPAVRTRGRTLFFLSRTRDAQWSGSGGAVVVRSVELLYSQEEREREREGEKEREREVMDGGKFIERLAR